MATQKEIVEKEQQRTGLEQMRKAYIYREGSFYRAYEWSAWLFVRHVSDFKVTCRNMKSLEQPVAFIGFPITSAGKFMPDGFQMQPNPDGTLDVLFPRHLIPDDADIEALAREYSEWKSSLPVSEPSKKGGESREERLPVNSQSSVEPMSLTAIMQRILAYPIESKSPLDSMAFLADIKQQLSHLI
ncbi:MAG: hypothetical protein MJZ31_12150 [Bacteroidales bacterium]|nr:hypothetical protein [Bacteroidales bacterium]